VSERQLHDNPEGHRWAVDKAFTIWFSMAPLRPLPHMAFSMQSKVYLASYVAWESPADDARCVDWLTSVMADLEPVTVGQYLGGPHGATNRNHWE
jgi:hypothetical protein